MSQLDRISLPQQMALALKEDIGKGVWVGTLPGYRILQDRYQVSKVTCERALKLLETEGILKPPEPRKRREISVRSAKKCTNRDLGTLLIVSDIGSNLFPDVKELLVDCAHFWSEQGGHIRQQVVDMPGHLHPEKLINSWIQGTDVVAIVLFLPSSTWVDAARDTGLHVFRFGGGLGNPPDLGTQVGYMVNSTYPAVFDYLRAKGHRRLLIPWKQTYCNWRPVVVDVFKKTYGDCLSEKEIENSIPLVDYLGVQDWHGYWAKALSVHKPTVVVLEKALEAVSLVCHCGAAGIAVPKNLSIFVMDGVSPISWISPPIANLTFEPRYEIKQFIKWVQGGFVPRGVLECPFTLDEGKSVAQLG